MVNKEEQTGTNSEEDKFEILNAIYEVELDLLNHIETVRCMVRDQGTLELTECDSDITLRDKFALWYMERHPNCFPSVTYEFADEMIAVRGKS